MAGSADTMTACLSMDGEVSDLAQRLHPDVVSELVLSNCVIGGSNELCSQIGRCVGLRSLRCVGCALVPSHLVWTVIQQLPNLERLEFSLVGADAAVDAEIIILRQISSQMQGSTSLHNLRRLYVEVGGDRNFRLLWELLGFFPRLAELHVHLVRGTFSNALSECRRIQGELGQLGTFTFTSEQPTTVPFLYEPYTSLGFANCAAICANVRYTSLGDSWSCVDLHRLAFSSHRMGALPTQLVVAAVPDDITSDSFRLVACQNVWARVRQLCLLLLPPEPPDVATPFRSVVVYPTAGAAFGDELRQFFSFTLAQIVELNVSSFHFDPDLDLMELLPQGPLNRLQAFSAPVCAFRSQSAVLRLPAVCPNLRDLDVRSDTRGGRLVCLSCERPYYGQWHQRPSDDEVELSPKNGIARLTLSAVPARLLHWFVECCRGALTVRLAEWPVVGSLRLDELSAFLGGSGAVRCLVLGHKHLKIVDRELWDCLCRMTSLRHLSLVTSVPHKETDISAYVCAFTYRVPQLKCLHLHCRHESGDFEQRVTWLRRQAVVLLYDRPCFGCCSTATFIGLAKPLNRDCEACL